MGITKKGTRDAPVFLDVLCIHQTDEKVKLEGVYSLGGFLVNTKHMMILWSPPYFTRLWCVFEIAAYFSILTEDALRNIIFRPLFLDVTRLVVFVVWWISAPLSIAASTTIGDGALLFNGLLFIFSLTYFFSIFASIRGLMRQKKDLFQQLESFDCTKAQCRDDKDREFVMSHIAMMYGDESKFNAFV